MQAHATYRTVTAVDDEFAQVRRQIARTRRQRQAPSSVAMIEREREVAAQRSRVAAKQRAEALEQRLQLGRAFEREAACGFAFTLHGYFAVRDRGRLAIRCIDPL